MPFGDSRFSVVLPLAAIGLALLGIFPLATLLANTSTLLWVPLAYGDWVISVPIILALCVLLAAGMGRRLDALIERGRALLLAPSPAVFGALISAVMLLLSAYFAWYCFGGQPSSGDEMSQQFQAHLLLHGRLWAHAEPHLEFFDTGQTVSIGGRWFAQFPIGSAIFLALGDAVKAGWLVNPVLAAWTAHSLYRFCAQIMDEATARGTTLLFTLSPFVLLMSATEMNHTGALAFVMFALATLPEWATSDDPLKVQRAAMLIGLGLGVAATLRPYDALLVAIVIGVFQITAVQGSSVRRDALAWQITMAFVPVAILLAANWRTTGQPMLFGYEALNGPGHRPGFHTDPTGTAFTPREGLYLVSAYLMRLNDALFARAFPALLLIAPTWQFLRGPTRWDYLLVGLIGAIVLGYGAYWAEGYFVHGPRFLFTAVPAFLVFAAKMPGVVASRVRRPVLKRAVMLLIPMTLLITWAHPATADDIVGVWSAAAHLRAAQPELRADIGAQIAKADLTNALVFVPEPFQGRLQARLRALGLPAMMAEHLVQVLDACALQQGLDAADTLSSSHSTMLRLMLVIATATRAGPAEHGMRIAFIGGKPSTAACAHELAIDSAGTASLAAFLRYDGLDADGMLGGRVVFVRDFGARDELLRSRFGDRTWYRYRPRANASDTSSVFVPYVGTGG